MPSDAQEDELAHRTVVHGLNGELVHSPPIFRRESQEQREQEQQQKKPSSTERGARPIVPSRPSALSGWLGKRHQSSQVTWGRRWFTIDDERGRFHYQRHPKADIKVSIPLADTVIYLVEDDGTHQHCFAVSCPPIRLVLSAASRTEKLHWVDQLQSNITAWQSKAIEAGLRVAKNIPGSAFEGVDAAVQRRSRGRAEATSAGHEECCRDRSAAFDVCSLDGDPMEVAKGMARGQQGRIYKRLRNLVRQPATTHRVGPAPASAHAHASAHPPCPPVVDECELDPRGVYEGDAARWSDGSEEFAEPQPPPPRRSLRVEPVYVHKIAWGSAHSSEHGSVRG